MKTKNFNFVVKPNFKDYDIILFCIGHDKYKNLNFKAFNKFTYFFDLNYIFSNTKICKFSQPGLLEILSSLFITL